MLALLVLFLISPGLLVFFWHPLLPCIQQNNPANRKLREDHGQVMISKIPIFTLGAKIQFLQASIRNPVIDYGDEEAVFESMALIDKVLVAPKVLFSNRLS